MRVMTYNVHGLHDDADAVVRVIRDAQPDVVVIQEAPRFLRWRSKGAALARRCDLVAVAGGRTAAGNFLMCRMAVAVESADEGMFARRPGLHRRGVVVAVCSLAGQRFGVVGTHLDLVASERRRHAEQVLAAAPSDLPLIVAGDINEPPGAPAWSVFTARLTDAYAMAGTGPAETFSVARPRHRIDGIFVSPGIAVQSCTVLDSSDVRVGSDHRPVVAELQIG